MKVFTIENETNNITLHASVQDAEAVTNAEHFRNEAGLAKLAADWPAARLVAIWNSLPGVTMVTKFKDRKTGTARIWQQIQTLTADSPEADDAPLTQSNAAVEPDAAPAGAEAALEPEAPAGAEPESMAEAAAADADPQTPDVAPETAPATDRATATDDTAKAIDRDECSRLLEVAAEAQAAYWDALRNLEQAVGFEIDGPGDLENTTLADLIELRDAGRKRQARRAAPATAKAPRENSKTTQVIQMLKREGGTTLEEIMTAMQWQKHTTRAMLSTGGSLTKKHGLTVVSETVGDVRRYSIRN